MTGETIPIRLFLGGFDLTPTFRDVNKKYSTRYYLSLVLIDEGWYLLWLLMDLSVVLVKTASKMSNSGQKCGCIRWVYVANNRRQLKQVVWTGWGYPTPSTSSDFAASRKPPH